MECCDNDVWGRYGNGLLAGGSGLRVGKASGPTGSGVLVTATLIGSLSTTGFTALELSFTNNVEDNLEYDATSGTYGTGDDDGFLITSTQSISFDTSGANATAFETALDPSAGAGADVTWNAASATTHSQDLAFDATANDGMISNLVIRLQVNATAERIDLKNFQIIGTAVPEPGAFLFGGSLCILLGLVFGGRQLFGDDN